MFEGFSIQWFASFQQSLGDICHALDLSCLRSETLSEATFRWKIILVSGKAMMVHQRHKLEVWTLRAQ